jgi:predicted acetyltransferase
MAAMGITLRWIGEKDLDRVAQVQTRCYGSGDRECEGTTAGLRKQFATGCIEFVLAEREGEAVATAGCWAFTMWVRGAALACQGVAGVGTIRTERRGRGGADEGTASQLMREVVAHARERGQVVSALMPFRSSFYEHFGYGVVERRCRWVVPLSSLPTGPLGGVDYYRPEDLAGIQRLRQQMVQGGQCDIERLGCTWEGFAQQFRDGFTIVDRGDAGDAGVRSWMLLRQREEDGRRILEAREMGYESLSALQRQLHFLAAQRDQFAAVELDLPVDLPLNWLLKERQVSGGPLNHPCARLRQANRMQVRILDHKRFLEALHLPQQTRGRAVIAIHETEGSVSRFSMEVADGRVVVRPSDTTADAECCDRTWAALACGELSVTQAQAMELITMRHARAVPVLESLGVGPVPFCREDF